MNALRAVVRPSTRATPFACRRQPILLMNPALRQRWLSQTSEASPKEAQIPPESSESSAQGESAPAESSRGAEGAQGALLEDLKKRLQAKEAEVVELTVRRPSSSSAWLMSD